MPSQLDFARFMAAMPDAAQSQYITFLLDFLDDQTAGRNQGEFGWIKVTRPPANARWNGCGRARPICIGSCKCSEMRGGRKPSIDY